MCRVLLLVYVMLVNALLSEYAVSKEANSCPPLILLRGRVKYRQKGKFAKFLCNTGYMLAGERYSSCIKGKWDEKVPVCVKPSCSRIKQPLNGLIYPQYNGAVINFFCKAGYVLRGNSVAYCDGFRWSTNLPSCVLSGAEPAMACDFESEDMCGWTHDLNHDFDWTRYNLQTPSGHIGTGPHWDHTKGKNKDGYYMYIESSSRIENDSARLLSPLYDKMERGMCFTFYYHMYGTGMGTLRVYVKAASQTYSTKFLRPNFVRSGNQGDVWKKGVVSLASVNEPFQVIIEGLRGKSYVSDIAIDDVKLVSAECDDEEFMFSTTEQSTDIAPMIETCLNRCNNNSDTIYHESFVLACDCVESCIENNSCCPDYIASCVLDSSTDYSESYEFSTVASETESTADYWALANENTATVWETGDTTGTQKPATESTVPKHDTTGYPFDVETTTVRSTTLRTTKTLPNLTKSVPTTTPAPSVNNSQRYNANATRAVFKFNRTLAVPAKALNVSSSARNDTETKLQPSRIVPNVTSTSTVKHAYNVTKPKLNRTVTLRTNATITSKPNSPKNASGVKSTTESNAKPKMDDAIVLTTKSTPKHMPSVNTSAVLKPIPLKPIVVPSTKSRAPESSTSQLVFAAGTTDSPATLEMETDYSESEEVLVEHATAEQVSKYAERHREPATETTHLVMGLLCAVVFIMLVVLSAVFVARRYNVRLCHRFQNSRYSESMSDVRFLTNDEMLDFTWRSAHN